MTVPKRKPGRPPKHGGYSGTELVPITKEKVALINSLLTGSVTIIGPVDEVAVSLLARNLAKIEIIDRWLQVHGLFSDEKLGTPQPVLKIYWAAMNGAARMCDALGLTPTSRMRLGLGMAHVASDLGERMADARED